jgi:hypothetical protein
MLPSYNNQSCNVDLYLQKKIEKTVHQKQSKAHPFAIIKRKIKKKKKKMNKFSLLYLLSYFKIVIHHVI